MALFKVAADQRHLLDAQGRPFFVMGVNYAGHFDRAWRMWEDDLFDPALIERDFRKVWESGFNSIRLFVHAALEADLRNGNFEKLDQTLSLAQDHKLRVLLTCNDTHSVNLARVSDLDAKIAERYKEVPTIFAFDLQNEPVFYNLVAATYPEGRPAPVQTSQLVEHYGERVNRAEALELRQQRRIPVFLADDIAYFYINALRLFLEYDRDMNNFVRQGRGNVVDFMLSADAERWYTFIEVMDQTIDTWLRARLEPIRATGCRHLITVGWSWLHFATLPANRQLDFQQYHNYAALSLSGFNTNVQQMRAMQQAFPSQPVIFGEFGWSNQSTENPETSQPVSTDLTGLYEAATFAYLRSSGFGGGMKWMLNDVDITHNPREASFGVFEVGDHAKPVRDLILRLSEDWPVLPQPTEFVSIRDRDDGLAYRFNYPGQITIGGKFYQDEHLTWSADGETGHCYIKIANNELQLDAQRSGRLSITPWELLPDWDRARECRLYRLFGENRRTQQQTFGVGQAVVVNLVPGVQYAITMGSAVPTDPPPQGLPLPEPKPGEHVVLLGDSDEQLQAALGYLRRFGPDFSFAPDEVTGKWAYVSVVATPAQISDTVLAEIRSFGTLLVERVVGDSPAETEVLLNDMARRGYRFRTGGTPPRDEPPVLPTPEEPMPTPPPPPDEIYVVQPGDTLGGIAKKVYGDFRLWPVVFEANRDKIADANLIRVGMELLIPTQA